MSNFFIDLSVPMERILLMHSDDDLEEPQQPFTGVFGPLVP